MTVSPPALPHNKCYLHHHDGETQNKSPEQTRIGQAVISAIHASQPNREETKILDEFFAVTGYHRKHAIRVLRKGVSSFPRERRGWQRTYTGAVVSALIEIWRICG